MAVNTGTKTTSVVRIVALVYDTKGQPIWAEAGFVDNNILPGQSSPFSMVLPDSSAVEVIGDIPAAETSVNGLGLDPSAHPAAAPGWQDGTIGLNGQAGYSAVRLQVSTVIYDPES